MSRSVGLLLTAVLLAPGGATARASTLTVAPGPPYYEPDGRIDAYYVTAPGEVNDLTVVGDTGAANLLLHDPGADIAIGNASVGPAFPIGPSFRCAASGHFGTCTSTPGPAFPTAGQLNAVYGFARVIVDARASAARVRVAGPAAIVSTGTAASSVDVRDTTFDEVHCAAGNATTVLADPTDAVDAGCAQVLRGGTSVARVRGELLGESYDVTVP